MVDPVHAKALQDVFQATATRVLPYSSAVVMAVLTEDGSTHFGAYGLLDRPGTEAVTSDTVFDLLSVTKAVVTAPLAMILIDQGILDLDASITSIIPECVQSKVSVHHLLAHSSGLSDSDLDFDHHDPDLAWKKMFSAPLHFEPGTSTEYADLNYRLLGKVLERVGGAPLDELAQALLFKPLGMTSTCFNPPPELLPKIAGRGRLRGRTEDLQVLALGGVAGCDGAFSTATDLMTFAAMMLNGGISPSHQRRILSHESVKRLTTAQSTHPQGHSIIADETTDLLFAAKTCGFEFAGSPFCHGGASISDKSYGKAGGVGSFLWIDPMRKMAFTVLTNYGFPWPFTSAAWNKLVREIAPNKFIDEAIAALSMHA